MTNRITHVHAPWSAKCTCGPYTDDHCEIHGDLALASRPDPATDTAAPGEGSDR